MDAVNLQMSNVYIPKGKFFIAIEWLLLDENKVVRNTKMDGKKTEWIYYRPEIGLETVTEGAPLSTWQLAPDNKWIHWWSTAKRLRISATVLY